jgi:signal transduction histidine kinase
LEVRLNPDEARAVRAFYEVLEQVRERTDRDGDVAMSRVPALAALFARADPAQLMARRAASRQLEREAVVEERWEGYAEHLAAVGASYAGLGIAFSDWFNVSNSYRAGVYDEALAAGADRALLVLTGMDCFHRATMALLATGYMQAKQRIVVQAQTQRDLYIDMFRNASLGMMIYEWSAPPDLGSFRAIAANPAAIAMFPVPAEQILGFTIREARPAILETEVPAHYAAAVDRGESASWTLARDGTTFNARSFPLQGRFVGVMFEDATERRRLAAEVEQHSKHLERSNRDLDDFAYVASHDLKAPLRDIDNLASWIAEDARDILPAASKRHLSLLQDRIGRMERLLDDLLAYSRADRLPGASEELDVHAVIESSLSLVGPHDGFTISVVGDRPTLRAPRVPLQQVIRNLVTNGIKHHHRKQGTITVSVVEREKHVEIAVTDDGPGIPAEFHERVFRMFQTLRPRDEVEGSGMGLAIVKKVVESHGGTVRVESAPGQGTTMHVAWPKSSPARPGAGL